MTTIMLKYSSRCRTCGRVLNPGQKVKGFKDDGSGKWHFECLSCPPKSASPGPEGRLEHAAEDKEAMENLKKITGTIDGDVLEGADLLKILDSDSGLSGVTVRAQVAQCVPAMSEFERIQANAKWRF